jgi:multiple sugar transport system permease protein
VIAVPAAVAIYIGFTEWTLTSGDPWYRAYRSWVWFDGYREVLTSSDFWMAIWRSVVITVAAVAVEFVLGLLLAFLFVREFRGRTFLMLCLLLPMLVVPAVAGFIFSLLLQVDGPVNAALSAVLPGEVRIPWLTDPDIALWSLVIVDIWQWTPLMFLILLAGLLAVPEDQLNAARTLGAGFWHTLRLVVLPLMKPVIVVALVIRAIEAFKIFDTAWLLVQGGPGEATTTISVFLFRQTFIGARFGFAAAVGIVVVVLVSIVAVRAIRPIERAQGEVDPQAVPGPAGARALERDVPRPAVRARAASGPSEPARPAPLRLQPSHRRGAWVRLRPAAKWLVIATFWTALMFPLYWTVTMAFKPLPEWQPVDRVLWVPEKPTTANFEGVLGLGPGQGFGGSGSVEALKNSVIAATGGTLLALTVGILGAYGVARFRGGGRLLPFQILQLRMIPPVAIMIPLLAFWASIGLVDSLPGLIIVYGAITFPFVVWLMRSFFQEVPREIAEAAVVDGCTYWGAFVRAVLPLVKAGIAVTALFVFILNWSDFLIVSMLSHRDLITAPMQLNVMQTLRPVRNYGPESALAVLLLIPPALLGLAIQRYLVRGLTFGAIRR